MFSPLRKPPALGRPGRLLTPRNKLLLWGAVHLAVLGAFLLAGGLSVSTSLYAILPDTGASPELVRAEAALAVAGTTAAGSFWFGRRRKRIRL